MKKILTLLLLVLCCATGYSKHVSADLAKNVGYNFLSQKGGANLASSSDLNLLYTLSGSSEELFYVFGTGHCFVIVAAEDNVTPVLGYSLNNTFIDKNIPSHVSGYLDVYGKQIEYVKANNLTATTEIATNWTNLISNIKSNAAAAARTTTVSPLLGTTWDQYPNYNANCPYDAAASAFGSHDVTGCVATATAQVMKFWGWPTTGSGFHSYSTSSYGTLSANFATHTYNWSAMPSSVGSTNTAVAQLMSDVGISVDMNYTSTESSAYVISATSAVTNCSEYALKTYFNYDPSLHGEQRSYYSDATWISMLEADLNAGHPIIYDGHGSGGGHCFVFDGYDASNYFHVNWGWSGAYDGYFDINALNPSGTGTGGGTGAFNSGQEAILGVKPASSGGGGGGSASSDTLALYDYVNLSASTINYGTGFTVTTNLWNYNTSGSFTGDFCAAAFDYTTGSFVCFVDSVMGVTVGAGYTTGTLTFNTSGLLAMLPGNYTIGVFYRRSGGGWNAAWNYSSYTNFVTMIVVNHNPIELSAAMVPTPTNFVQGSPGSVTLNLTNYSTTSYSGSYDVSLFNLDGTFNSTIQTMSGMSLASGSTYSTPLTFSTSSITAAPGTYLLACQFYYSTSWYLCGADYFTNPIYVTVVAPPPSPDVYEVNNTAATAYNLPVTFASNVANPATPGSNLHVTTDQDYYKIVLPAGYRYYVKPRVNDIVNSDDAVSYTTDVTWSYSTDGGTTWSAIYNDSMTGGIYIPGVAGGTVIFHVSPAYAGNIGTYLLKMGVTRYSNVSVPEINLEALKIYPNPASDFVTIDLQQTNTSANTVCITNVEGKQVYCDNVKGQSLIKVPVNTLANGMYFVELGTDEGIIKKEITVNR